MPTYRERSEDAENDILIDRVRNGLVKFVIYKFGTSATDPEKRLGLQILASPNAFARTFAVGVASNDFWRSGNPADDPQPDTAQGDTNLQSILEATLWPIYATEAPQ